MAKRHFLQQAHTYKDAISPAGMLLSEKLDGQRCFWDGGITRNLPASLVPWANIERDKKERICTGLWSRYGKPIHAPDWWLNKLPKIPLDGELFCGRGGHQMTRSIVSKHIPTKEWLFVQFVVFDSPRFDDIFYDSVIDIPNYKIELSNVLAWISDRNKTLLYHRPNNINAYADVYKWLQERTNENDVYRIIDQHRLSAEGTTARIVMRDLFTEIVADGGEGIVLRHPGSFYTPERSHNVLKMKPKNDAEATVVGYITGRETDKGSKLLGLMGAMLVKYKNVVFELSGFTDAERTLIDTDMVNLSQYDALKSARMWAEAYPETKCPPNIIAKHFPPGSVVTFKYRELTDAGVPKEAAYLRKHNV